MHKEQVKGPTGKSSVKVEETFANTATITNICFPWTQKWLEHKDRISKKLQIFRSRFRGFCRIRYYFEARFKKLPERKTKSKRNNGKKLGFEQKIFFLISQT
jgi:hypothetical protein